MNAGAFSNEAAAKSAAALVAIKVDCTKPGQNEDVQKKYKVQGYPTVLFVTNEEKMVEDLYPQDGAAFARQLDAFVKKHAKPAAWAVPWSAALSKAGKPMVVLVPEKAPPSWDDTRKELEKELGKDAEKFRFSYALPGSAEMKALEKLAGEKARAGGFVVLKGEKIRSDPGPVTPEKRAEILKGLAKER